MSVSEDVTLRVDNEVLAFYDKLALRAGTDRETAMAVLLALTTMQELPDGT